MDVRHGGHHHRNDEDEETPAPSTETLQEVARNLTAQAAEGKLRPAYGRDAAVEAVLATLAQPERSHTVLVGRSGVGKTAIIHEVVRRIQAGNCPAALKGRQVWATSALEILAGQKYIGEWQGRMQSICRELIASGSILYIEEVAGLAEAGRYDKSDDNMAQFLKPYLQSGQIKLVGESSPERLRTLERLEPGFASAVRTLQIQAPSPAEARPMLSQVAADLKARLRVEFEPGALGAAIDLAGRFLPHEALPGNLVRLLERVAGQVRDGAGQGAVTVTPAQMVERFTALTGLPRQLLLDEEPLSPAQVREFFAQRILGQPDAIEAVVDLMTLIKAGLGDPSKPFGVFLFVGPTGVGKTELAKALAEFIFGNRERLVRFDMSEYGDRSAIDRLVGTPWSKDREGELTGRIREQPLSVVLLDEIEKANPAVFDLLLQVLGEGRLTDATGRTTHFQSTVIIMTSNLGASARERRTLGFGSSAEEFEWEEHFLAEAERFFRPEFLNRIDRIVAFHPLDREALRKVAQRELGHLLMREGIVRRSVLVQIDDSVMDLLLELGVSPEYGARPLKRAIERTVILPIARHLVSSPPAGPELLRLTQYNGGVKVTVQRLEEPGEPAGYTAPPARLRSLKEVAAAIGELRARVDALGGSGQVGLLQEEKESLLGQSAAPAFWDDPTGAHRVLARIYHLDRVLRRVGQLAAKAEHLAEFAAVVLRDRDDQYLSELELLHGELDREISFVELECLTVDDAGADHALLRIHPVAGDAAWACRVAAAYARWALQKGYVLRLLLSDGDRWREITPEQTRGALKDLAAGKGAAAAALALSGVRVYSFLAGEQGAHQLITREDGQERTVLAGLSVAPLSEEQFRQPPGALAAEGGALPGDLAVVRIYVSAGERSVRDPRTGVRTARLKETLQGHLDEFLLASLRSRTATSMEGNPA